MREIIVICILIVVGSIVGSKLIDVAYNEIKEANQKTQQSSP